VITLKGKLIVWGISLILGSLILSSAVYAPWTTLGTGYAITSNVHGIDILPGIPVTVTAGTLDSRVANVTFRWHRPAGSLLPPIPDVTKPVYTNGTMGQWNNGTWALIRYANDTQVPDEIGDWGVQAFFQDSAGNDRAGLEDVIKIRATSFNVIPEIPLGTIAASVAMFIAFGLFIIKKKRIPEIVGRVK